MKNSVMKNEFVRLLRDETEEVLNNLVPRIGTILSLFLTSGTINIERQDPISNEISKALLKCLAHLMKGYNWRLTASLVKEMEILPMVFKSDQINNDFTPQIVRCALYGVSFSRLLLVGNINNLFMHAFCIKRGTFCKYFSGGIIAIIVDIFIINRDINP